MRSEWVRLRDMLFGWAALALLVGSSPLVADDIPEKNKAAIKRGRSWLLANLPTENKVGELALGTLALIVSGESEDHPVVLEAVEKLKSKTIRGGEFQPERSGGADNYEAGAVLMAFSKAGQEKHFAEIKAVTAYILKKQIKNGAWHYGNGGKDDTQVGDTSMTQYCILGLWDAVNAGVEVPVQVWDEAMFWLIRTQDPNGGFTYHPSIPKDGEKSTQQGDLRHSMAAAAGGSLVICQKHLPKTQKKRGAIAEEMLIPVLEEKEEIYEPKCTKEMAESAISRARNWLNNNFTIEKCNPGGYIYYYLYALERFAALQVVGDGGGAGAREKNRKIGNVDWYGAGASFLLGEQREDGSWDDRHGHGPIASTAWALLFLGRATEKKVEKWKLKQLEAGTMTGGRGRPATDGVDPSLARRMKERHRQALRAPVEDLLSILNDPDAIDNVEQAAAGLEKIDPEKLVKSFANNPKQLKKLVRDERPAVRRAVIVALGRSRDFKAVPLVIEALSDPAPEVYSAAAEMLRFMARRPDAASLPKANPTPEQIAAAKAEWTAWFQSLNVEIDTEQEFEGINPLLKTSTP